MGRRKMTDNVALNDVNKEIKDSSESRRLIIVTGDKGGVGKSTFARALIQTYIDNKKDFLGFDADLSNPQIKRFYGEECDISPLNIFKSGTIDIFVQNLRSFIYLDSKQEGGEKLPGKSLFLLELPPQSSNILRDFVSEMDLFNIVKESYNMRVTLVVVINRTIDSVNQLVGLHEYCKEQGDYIVVKNNFFGESEDFHRYNNSSLIKEIKEKQKKENNQYFYEICMPELIEHAYDYVDANSCTFSQAIAQDEMIAVKGRVTAWLRNFKQSIEPVKGLLGLKDVTLQ